MADQQVGIRRTIIIIVCFIVLVIFGFIWRMNQPVIMSVQDLRINGAIVLNTPRKFSDFDLIDHRGDAFTLERLKGQWSMIFFGFTNCPDVCPMTLTNLDQVIEKLDENENNRLKVFFVSIDPERDSPQVIKDYLDSFKNKIYGITGDPQKVFSLSKSWGVLSEKIFNEDGSYLINHSSSIILLRKGKYIDRISHHENLDNIFKIIKNYL